MREILYTAGQASFSSFHFLTRVEGLQWPPRSGPEADRGGAVLAVLEMTQPSLGPPNEEDREPAPVVRLPAEIPAGGGQLLVIAPAQESTHAQVCAAMDEARNKGWAGTTLAGGRP